MGEWLQRYGETIAMTLSAHALESGGRLDRVCSRRYRSKNGVPGMRRITRCVERVLLAGIVLAAGLLPGCGLGTTAAVVAAGNDDPENTDPVISDASVSDTRNSPATIRFRLTDAESDPVNIELLYQLPGEAEVPMLLVGDTNLKNLAATPTGVVHERYWDFASQLPLGGGYEQGVIVIVRREGSSEGISSIVSGANIGNDAPEVLDPTPRLDPETQEVRGLVLIDMLVADSSGDVIELEVAFLDPDGVWREATYSLADAIPPIQATPTGTPFTFIWDSDTDGAEAEWTTTLRFTASDDTDTHAPVATLPFAVDNNREPIAALDEPIDNPDRRGAIAVSYRIIDEESDPTPVVFQWRRQGETFPELPQSMATLQALLEDPEGRRLNHICTEAPAVFRGRVATLPAGADPDIQVRLPELADSAANLVSSGLGERRIDVLRRSSSPAPAKATWSEDPELDAPVAALPLAGGLAALVLDGSGASWNLRAIELATGRPLLAMLDAGPGAPLTMAWETEEHALLVAAQTGDDWVLYRVTLESGVAVPLVSSADGSTEAGPVRGVVSLGDSAALLTVGSSLVRADYASQSTKRATTLVAGLQTPWGIALDPLRRNRVYLAERDFDPGPPASGPVGRVLALQFDTYDRPPVLAWWLGGRRSDGSPGFPRPQALALERDGARLLAVTDHETSDGTRELRAVDLGGERLGEIVELGAGLVTSLGERSGLSIGPEGLGLLTLETQNDLAVGGGILQSRTMIPFDPQEPDRPPYDPATQVATVAVPFDPLPEANDPWRIAASAPIASSSPTGVDDVFVWDSSDVPGGGEVFLRVTPLGLSETGVPAESAIHKTIDHPWATEPLALAAPGTAEAVAIGDLDGDGLLDLACAGHLSDQAEGRLSVYYQTSPGEFPDAPQLVLGTMVTDPRSVAISDLNGDGRPDIVCANGGLGTACSWSDRLIVFLQDAAGGFGPGPSVVLGDSETTAEPCSVVAADLNGDGWLDLVSANAQSDNVAIFLQQEPGVFHSSPDEVLGASAIRAPRDVAAADLNGDGRLDLVSANSTGNDLAVFLQGESGSFGVDPDLTLGDPTSLDFPCSAVAADLNGDGRLDLVAASQAGNDLVVFLQPAEGFASTAVPDLVLGSGGYASGPRSVEAADLDGDGRLDLVSANESSENLHVFLQDPSGGFPSSPLILGSSLVTGEPQSVRTADLNGDGRLDIVSANAWTGDLAVFLRTALGSFDERPDMTIGDANTIVGVVSLAAADLDGDRLNDLVTSDFNTHRLMIYPQVAPGVFSLAPEYVLGGEGVLYRPRYVVVADVSGDGRLDVLSANSGSDDIAVFLQDASGGFDAIPDRILGGVDGPECLVAEDLDNDGRLDLVSANAPANDLAVFLQDATGTFPATPSYLLGDGETTYRPVFVVGADLDGDGLVDLATANEKGNDIAVFFQLPSGGFSTSPDLALGNGSTTIGPLGLVAADLSGDGLLDLVSANSGGNLTVFFQVAPRQFSSDPLFLQGVDLPMRMVYVCASDLNGDGLLDLAAANLTGNRLIAFFQLAPGIFPERPQVVVGDASTTQGPRFLISADLNGDGSPDLVAANRATRTLAVFLNE